jgi:uncharacterized repeat protein (TIGR01451 family)
MNRKTVSGLFFLVLFAAAVVAVQQIVKADKSTNPIQLKSVVEVELVVVNKKGEKEIVRKDVSKHSVVPGDTIVLTTQYTNTGTKPIPNLSVKNPVPQSTVYIAGSAEGKDAKIEFSVDRGKTYGLPDTLKIKLPDGKERKAVAADYTDVKWTLTKPVAGGAKGSVSFKVKLK